MNMNVSGARGLCTLCCLGLLVLLASSDAHASVVVPNRSQRGFKDNVSNRIAHGFGKRTFQDTYDLAPSLDDGKNLITPRKLAELIMYDRNLAYIVALKLDSNGDGVISMNELILKDYV